MFSLLSGNADVDLCSFGCCTKRLLSIPEKRSLGKESGRKRSIMVVHLSPSTLFQYLIFFIFFFLARSRTLSYPTHVGLAGVLCPPPELLTEPDAVERAKGNGAAESDCPDAGDNQTDGEDHDGDSRQDESNGAVSEHLERLVDGHVGDTELGHDGALGEDAGDKGGLVGRDVGANGLASRVDGRERHDRHDECFNRSPVFFPCQRLASLVGSSWSFRVGDRAPHRRKEGAIYSHVHLRVHPVLVDLAGKHVCLQQPELPLSILALRDPLRRLRRLDRSHRCTLVRQADLDIALRDARKVSRRCGQLVQPQVGLEGAGDVVQGRQVVADAGASRVGGCGQLKQGLCALLVRQRVPSRHVDGAVGVHNNTTSLPLGDDVRRLVLVLAKVLDPPLQVPGQQVLNRHGLVASLRTGRQHGGRQDGSPKHIDVVSGKKDSSYSQVQVVAGAISFNRSDSVFDVCP